MSNRVIKFRAWGPNCKVMWDWEQVKSIANDLGWENFDKGERKLMQFTGLHDKNGVEIYEGDILSYLGYKNLGHDTVKSIGAVKYGETGDSDGWAHGKHYEYVVGADSLADVADSDYPDESYCEVIGNIYENPDLLERDA